MKESFFRSEAIDQAGQQKFLERRDGPGLLRFFIHYSLFLACAVMVVAGWDTYGWKISPFALGFGLLSCSMFAGLHEIAHQTAFKTRWLNTLTGYLFAFPNLYTYTGFREFHFQHHRYTHIPGKDPEISFNQQAAPYWHLSPITWLIWNSGMSVFMGKVMLLITAALGPHLPTWKLLWSYCPKKSETRLAWEARAVVLFNGICIWLAFTHLPGIGLLYLGLFLGHTVLTFYLGAEHTGLPHEGSILERTRSVKTNGFVKFFMWNMPYHAEHHAYPAVPFHALPALSEALAPELKHTAKSYPRFHLGLIKNMFQPKPRS